MQKIITYIEKFVKLSESAKEALFQYAEKECYLKNEFILESGQRSNKIWFINSGMVRKYHYHNGKETTTWIHCENEIFTSLQSYAEQIPADEYIQASEDVELISISRQNSEKLNQYEQIVTFTNILMSQQFANIDKNTRIFNQLDAKGRYEYLSQLAPEVVKRAKLGHIASILGITQETLSRIRK